MTFIRESYKAYAEVLEQQNSLEETTLSDIHKMKEDGKSSEEIAKKLKINAGLVKKILGEEVQEIKESFSDTQIALLKKEFDPLKNKQISTARANQLSNILDKLDDASLDKLKNALIPFVSALASVKTFSRKNRGVKVTSIKVPGLEGMAEEKIDLQEKPSIKQYVVFYSKDSPMKHKDFKAYDETELNKQIGEFLKQNPGYKVYGKSPSQSIKETMAEEKIPSDYLDYLRTIVLKNVDFYEVPPSQIIKSWRDEKNKDRFKGKTVDFKEENDYVGVHTKGKASVTANTSYEAAKKVADKLGLKSTAGITVMLSKKDGKDVVHTATEEVKENHIAIAMGKMLDEEGYMIKNQLEQIERFCTLLKTVITKDDMQVPAWVQAKVTLATDYLDTAANYMAGKEEEVKEQVTEDAELLDEKGPGLWANIRAKRARGERMRKPGEKGAPTAAQLKSAKGEEVEVTEDTSLIVALSATKLFYDWLKKTHNKEPKDLKAQEYSTLVKQYKKEEEVEEQSTQSKQNKIMKNVLDASRGAKFKLTNPVPDRGPEHKTAQAYNKAIGRALRNEDIEKQVTEDTFKNKIVKKIVKPIDDYLAQKEKDKEPIKENHFPVNTQVLYKGQKAQIVQVKEPQIGNYYLVKLDNGENVEANHSELSVVEGVLGGLAGAVVGSAAGIPGAVAGAYLGHKIQQAAKKKKEQVNKKINEGAKSLVEVITGLQNKADKTGMPYGILKQVYDRGMAAWKSGHRPGASQQQWAFARVNSFVTKSSGTWGGADKDLAAKVKGK